MLEVLLDVASSSGPETYGWDRHQAAASRRPDLDPSNRHLGPSCSGSVGWALVYGQRPKTKPARPRGTKPDRRRRRG